MQAAVVFGAGEVPRFSEFAEPQVEPGHEVVTLVAAAIHPVVRSKASGAHYSSAGAFPLIPGVDAVARTADGTLVYTGGVEEPYGTFAERISVPSRVMAPLPEGADPVAVAAGMNPGMASWMPLTGYLEGHASLGAVLIPGATGMAGGLAVQNALAAGASRVIAVGRNPEKLARVAGPSVETVALAGERESDAASIAAALGGAMPALTLDFLWGGVAEATFAAMVALPGAASEYVEIGGIAGAEARVPSALLRSRPFRLSGSGIGSFDMRRYLTEARRYVGMIAEGRVTVEASGHPLEQVAEAWAGSQDPRPVLTF